MKLAFELVQSVKSVALLQCRWASSNSLRTWIKQKGRDRMYSALLSWLLELGPGSDLLPSELSRKPKAEVTKQPCKLNSKGWQTRLRRDGRYKLFHSWQTRGKLKPGGAGNQLEINEFLEMKGRLTWEFRIPGSPGHKWIPCPLTDSVLWASTGRIRERLKAGQESWEGHLMPSSKGCRASQPIRGSRPA